MTNGRTVFLEKSKYVTKGKITFLTGYQINKSGDADKNVLHLIQIGEGGPKVYIQAMNPTYCELEYADPATGRWAPGVTARKARLH